MVQDRVLLLLHILLQATVLLKHLGNYMQPAINSATHYTFSYLLGQLRAFLLIYEVTILQFLVTRHINKTKMAAGIYTEA